MITEIIQVVLALIPMFKKPSDLEKIKKAIEQQEIHNAEEKQALLAAVASGNTDLINAILFG